MTTALARLRRDALARAAFVVDEDGAILASATDGEIQLEQLGHTAVERLGGVEGLARQVNVPAFGVLFHHVAGEDLYISALAGHTLAVLFDQRLTSVGTIRVRLNALHDELARELEAL